MARVIHLRFFTLLFSQVFSVHGICNVTKEAGGTLYTVPEFKGTEHQFSWSTKANNVLATHLGKSNEHVVKSSDRSLLLNECLDFVHFKIDGVSEDNTLLTFEVNCTTECWSNIEHRNNEGFTRHHWIILPVLLLLLVGSMLCRMCRHRVCRKGTCCCYPDLKTKDDILADLEAQCG